MNMKFGIVCSGIEAASVANLLLGWTGAVWLVTLIWSFTNQKETSIVINNTQGEAK